MNTSIRFVMGLLVSVFMLGAISGPSAQAQEKAKAPQATEKALLENDKVRVIEIHLKPGAVNMNVPREARVVRALTTGTIARIYPDGKTEKVEWKAGQVRFNPAVVGETPQYTTKNVGKSEVVLYVVALK